MSQIIDIQCTEIVPVTPAPQPEEKDVPRIVNSFQLRKNVWVCVELPVNYNKADHKRLTRYLKHFTSWAE